MGTVLIVDDTPSNLDVLRKYLGGSGIKVLIATSGESALEQVRLTVPDLVLLDVMMPGMDGFETCRRLKAERPTLPVVFMTALVSPDDKVRGFEAGAVDYVTKPFQHEEVMARVNAHLHIRQLQGELERSNEELEQRVVERTKALSGADRPQGAARARERVSPGGLEESGAFVAGGLRLGRR